MINEVLSSFKGQTIAFIGIICAFAVTCILLSTVSNLLPRDQGREFAHDGKLSAGKPRGAGIIFILVFVGTSLIFARLNAEILAYLALVTLAMLTGYLDDASKTPWGEYKKGFLDMLIAVGVTFTYVFNNGTTIYLASTGKELKYSIPIFCILCIILIWVSINVTNCTDGVDGLSGTVSLISLSTIYILNFFLTTNDAMFDYLILIFAVCILGYLWYNATPSKLMMGDAGSRAIGLFIAIAVLKMKSPFMYILVAFVLIVDGGLGLVKVTLLRFFKIHILKNVRTPLHDHVRKKRGWSNSQCVVRFAIVQIVASILAVYLVLSSLSNLIPIGY